MVTIYGRRAGVNPTLHRANRMSDSGTMSPNRGVPLAGLPITT